MQNQKVIYILEDDQDILFVVQYALEEAGYIVMGFKLAMRFYHKCMERLPDLFILDVSLPDGNGLAITNELIKQRGYKVPVIVISADASNDSKATEAGADAFIAKPFDMKALVAKVQKLLLAPAH